MKTWLTFQSPPCNIFSQKCFSKIDPEVESPTTPAELQPNSEIYVVLFAWEENFSLIYSVKPFSSRKFNIK